MASSDTRAFSLSAANLLANTLAESKASWTSCAFLCFHKLSSKSAVRNSMQKGKVA